MVELITIQNAIHLFFKNPLSLVSCTKTFATYIKFASLPHILSSIICVSFLNMVDAQLSDQNRTSWCLDYWKYLIMQKTDKN